MTRLDKEIQSSTQAGLNLLLSILFSSCCSLLHWPIALFLSSSPSIKQIQKSCSNPGCLFALSFPSEDSLHPLQHLNPLQPERPKYVSQHAHWFDRTATLFVRRLSAWSGRSGLLKSKGCCRQVEGHSKACSKRAEIAHGRRENDSTKRQDNASSCSSVVYGMRHSSYCQARA